MILILVSPRQRGLDLRAALGELTGECLVIAGGHEPIGSESAAELVRVADYTTDELVAAGMRLAERYPISTVVSFAEADVLAAATLRATLGVPGQQPDSAAAYRDKALMRHYTAQAGLPAPRWWCVETAEHVRLAVAEHGLPMVVKPRSLSGSVGVRILRAAADLDELPAELPHHVLESFVPGDVVHVDGLMAGSQPVFALPAAYTELGCLAHLADRGSGSHLLPREHPRHAELAAEMWQVVDALPHADNLVLHAEFFVRDGHRPVLCEIASRLPGHPIPPMIDRALNIDLRQHWLRIEAGLPVGVDALARTAAHAPLVANYGLPPRLGTLVDLPDRIPDGCADWAHDLAVLAQVGEQWDADRYATRKSGDFVLTWTIEAPDAASLAERIENSARQLDDLVRWA